MKTIDEYKKEILLMIMTEGEIKYIITPEGFMHNYVESLPKDDGLRTFLCELGAEYSYRYAYHVDKEPHPETRKAACRDTNYAFWYSKYIDKCPHEETRMAVCSSPGFSFWYAEEVDRGPHPETRKAAYKDSDYKQKYIEKFGE